MRELGHGVRANATFESQFGRALCACINSFRENPEAWIDYMCDPEYRSYDEPWAKLELRAFLRAGFSALPPLRFSRELSAISKSCLWGIGYGCVRHIRDISKIAYAHGLGRCVVGEMYWGCANPPNSAPEVLRDLALGIGRADRSHRKGLICPVFLYVGASIESFPGRGCVAFIHFPDVVAYGGAAPLGSRMSSAPKVGMKRLSPKTTGSVIDLSSSDDEGAPHHLTL